MIIPFPAMILYPVMFSLSGRQHAACFTALSAGDISAALACPGNVFSPIVKVTMMMNVFSPTVKVFHMNIP